MENFVAGLTRKSTRSKKSKSDAQTIQGVQVQMTEGQLKKLDGEAANSLFSTNEIKLFLNYLIESKLFDESYYISMLSEADRSRVNPIEHFFYHGYREGRQPNPIFDPKWYMETYPDTEAVQPFLHYVQIGERNGNKPSPLFDPTWYRAKYALPEDSSALAHYLANRSGNFSPIPEFDADYYLSTYKDIAEAKVDPFEHFLHFGYTEGRNPSAKFDTRFYIQRYFNGKAERNPLLHYLEHRHEPGIYPFPPEHDATIPAEIKRFTKPGAYFEEPRPVAGTAKPRARVLAYYLTQFHTFEENNRWWGTGFTEWTNIARGTPRFKDHYQPRVPRDLGFYSLENTDTMRRQVELAKGAGISGFIFYYYWFNQKRLMEKPLDRFLESRDIDMPFCLMWANENWSRRWDGLESEVLISQEYLSDDDDQLLADFSRHFKDPRYIRLGGRPLLMIYRPGIIPDAAKVIKRWRGLLARRFDEDPIIIMGQSFNDFDPTPYGLDGAIEFPPHKITNRIPSVNTSIEILDDTFAGQVFNYDDAIQCSLGEPDPPYPLIKTVVPSWDNDARRQGSGLVIHGSTPSKYEAWISTLLERAKRLPFFGEPIVCVNAWNEWCEGAYLEPDLHFGAAYLNATGRAVAGLTRDGSRPRLLLVGHDAFAGGAQYLLLNIGRTLRSAFGLEVEFLLLGGGQLESGYAAVAPVTILQEGAALEGAMQTVRDRGFTAAIVNTTAAGNAVAGLAKIGIRTVLLVHELPRLLKEKNLLSAARSGIESASHVVFPAAFVRDKLISTLQLLHSETFCVLPQGCYKQIDADPGQATILRRELGIAADAFVVLGVGYADMRKGFDLFLQVWSVLRSLGKSAHFCWLGGMDPSLKDWLGNEVDAATATGTFHLVGFRSDVDVFFAAADAFVLTSREDPFPTVVLEALSIGVPVFAFDKTGGIPEFLEKEELGVVVPYCDVPAMVMALRRLIDQGSDPVLQQRSQAIVEVEFSFTSYVRKLIGMALPSLPRVSVAVPNYNYAHCLADRLYSIFDQTHPTEEIIILDDASSDNSIAIIEDVARERERDLTLVINETNSGSVFAQWAKAAEMATGEFIWLAEADDLADPSFLANLLALLRTDPNIALAFSDSRSIDAQGLPVYSSYKPYFGTVEAEALNCTEVFEGSDFAQRFMAVKNVILNVSSVLWRREHLLRALAACENDLKSFKMAGDWRIYLEALWAPTAKIGYVADALNVHRRHSESVTHTLKAQIHIEEISRIHHLVRRKLRPMKTTVRRQAVYLEEVADQLLPPSQRANLT